MGPHYWTNSAAAGVESRELRIGPAPECQPVYGIRHTTVFQQSTAHSGNGLAGFGNRPHPIGPVPDDSVRSRQRAERDTINADEWHIRPKAESGAGFALRCHQEHSILAQSASLRTAGFGNIREYGCKERSGSRKHQYRYGPDASVPDSGKAVRTIPRRGIQYAEPCESE